MPTRKTTAKQASRTTMAPKKTTPKAARTKKAPAKKATRPVRPKKGTPTPPAAELAKKLSQFQAAIQVLAEAGEPMTAKGYWTSPGGKTLKATLYVSILRDTRRGEDARFRKTERGTFTTNA